MSTDEPTPTEGVLDTALGFLSAVVDELTADLDGDDALPADLGDLEESARWDVQRMRDGRQVHGLLSML